MVANAQNREEEEQTDDDTRNDDIDTKDPLEAQTFEGIPLSRVNEEDQDEGVYPKKFSDPNGFYTEHERASDEETIVINVKISQACVNLPSRQHMQSLHRTKIPKNGKMTIEEFKNQLSEIKGFPKAKDIQLLWFAKVIGRKYDDDVSVTVDGIDEKKLTLNDYNVMPWLIKFPEWQIVATVLDQPQLDRYEAIHRAVAISKGLDPDKYCKKLRKTDKWTTFLETDVEATKKNREFRLGAGN